ncbi:glycoside hydrolase [Brucepastera parasyntrophica]|uniref:glycosyl hydrolase family 18 protein n=1 Tax=Brucepastera parasyntrophica TaxID=2880008 RepID=UPI00210AB073|nr:glycosyl hydrolase family 18 protein [Brucepastera parasyntrophica]ULQ60768.1 glycoside hydrolase [Brucepastera parasyntrophica]
MKHFSSGVIFFFIAVTVLPAQLNERDLVNPPSSVFTEIWAYLMDGEEDRFDYSAPVTDIGYFGAGLNTFGKLVGVPDPAKIARFPGKIHLIVVDNGRALTHFSLNPAYNVREELITDIVQAAEPFDGVQIDFELVPKEDKEHYLSFLSMLKSLLGEKMLTVAIPARTRYLERDAYDYARIARTVDRVIVMAYDEHWSTSAPGPVASFDWCHRVSQYALATIGQEKLVMGLPFYGRAWGDINPSRAYRHVTLSELIKDKKVSGITRQQGVPTFTYQETVSVTVYFDDAISIAARAKMYERDAVRSIAFWRIGQEDPAVWKYLSVAQF